MTQTAQILNQYRQTGAIHEEIPLLRYVADSVFQTKSASFGMLLKLSGIDPDCRLDDDLDVYSRRIEKALKILDERFRMYQYMIKRFDSAIPHKGEYPDGPVGDFIGRRVGSLRRRSLASIALYFVVLYEGGGRQTGWAYPPRKQCGN